MGWDGRCPGPLVGSPRQDRFWRHVTLATDCFLNKSTVRRGVRASFKSCRAARTQATRGRVRRAATTWVESVRGLPRVLIQPRALQVARNGARHRGLAAWARPRGRPACPSVPSKPEACRSRRSASGPARPRRTASAAWRSVSPASYGIPTTQAKRPGAPAPGRPAGGESSAQSGSV
jgi:hypothetical protein